MKGWISQGLLGRPRGEALAPSRAALGPNTYLTERDFLKMLGVAFLFHVVIFIIATLMPREEVTNIPVRALSFKLGGGEKFHATTAPVTAPVMNMQAAPPPPLPAAVEETWQASPGTPAPTIPEPLKPIAKPVATPAPIPKKPKTYKIEDAPAIAPSPQQYVREVGAAPARQAAVIPTGSTESGISAAAAEQFIRARYEQEISGWIQQHKLYPAEAKGREGRAIVRVRIDRLGNVRYYAIEQSSGTTALDAAAIDMIRRANPMPAVPKDYPDGNIVEFLIPISFKAPQ